MLLFSPARPHPVISPKSIFLTVEAVTVTVIFGPQVADHRKEREAWRSRVTHNKPGLGNSLATSVVGNQLAIARRVSFLAERLK